MSSDLTLAALAAIPEREAILARVLGSLRPQVDVLCVYLNGWTKAPQSVLDLADHHVVDENNSGAEKKLHWARSHGGICLTCDDDLVYPPDYVRRMVAAIGQWGGRAIVTAHGRSYRGAPRNVLETVPNSIGIVHNFVHAGRWVNHAGTGVMAWDTRGVDLPAVWAERNMVDMQVALWAQKTRTPMWLIPHRAQWVKGLAVLDPHGLFQRSRAERHQRRSSALRTWRNWQIFSVAEGSV